MPLLLYHWKEVLELWLEAVDSADDEGLKPLLECVPISHGSAIILPLVILACFKSWCTTYGRPLLPYEAIFSLAY